MNFALRTNRRRGLALLEVLLAVAIALTFLGGTVLAFIEMMRASDRAQARLDAIANARHALETMSLEFSRAYLQPAGANRFTGQFADDGAGNRIDGDKDTLIDEELSDALDNDGDWLPADDKHALIDTARNIYERQRFRNVADLDDDHVDEDVKFVKSDVLFRTQPDDGTTNTRLVRFVIGSFDVDDNVLLEEVTTDAGGPDEAVTTSPIAFNVLAFNALYWDQNSSRYWVRTWNSDDFTTGAVPELPAAVNLSVTVYAGQPQTLAMISAAEGIDTLTLTTTADLEAVLADSRYNALRETY